MWPFKKTPYILATKAGVVDSVATGIVTIDGKIYAGLRATLVQPGQMVAKRQPIGKR